MPAAPANISELVALHYGASCGHLEVCRLMLQTRADTNATLPDLSTPLMLAVEEAKLNVATLLLAEGAMTRCRDEDGFTAASRCDPSIQREFQALLDALMPKETGL
eukprot:TRINITY_DN19099_c0_g1_i2.p1 TRINITY_DN19099_c0_g1~~TRINITY_DN19099_c0_g1_i2.p1  ORF type:complete len:106 (+),score=8.81 TRINITY_DN19099_c0_g1_i2:38-355(+)